MLTKHQHEGIKFLLEKKKAILNDEMGTGKTRQAIVASLNATSDNGRILVVAPASLLENWKREIDIVTNESVVTQIIQTKKDKASKNARFVIVSYDRLDAVLNEKFKVVVLDESHYIKGKSQRAKKSLLITENAEYVFLLTGTMLLNRPIELYNQLQAIGHPIAQNGKRTLFSRRYCNGHLRRLRNGRMFWDESGASNIRELNMLISPYVLRRTKSDVLDLPDKIRTRIDITMDKDYSKKYELAWEEYLEFLRETGQQEKIPRALTARHIIELNKLQQITSLSKVRTIAEHANNAVEQGESVIIFSNFTKTIEELHKAIQQSITLTGQTKDRQQVVDAIQSGGKKVLIANIKAGGVGLNITKANIVMFADLDYSPENMRQAEDRAHRQGQTKTVNIYYYIAKNTVDEHIYNLIQEKEKIIKNLQKTEQTIEF